MAESLIFWKWSGNSTPLDEQQSCSLQNKGYNKTKGDISEKFVNFMSGATFLFMINGYMSVPM